MKRTFFTLILSAVCSSFIFSATIVSTNKVNDDYEDYIALSREGGTTRLASSRMLGVVSTPVEPVVEARSFDNVIAINVQNYRGGAWVEVFGKKGAKQACFEVFDMGFDVINISDLDVGEYTIRITLDSAIYTGKLNKNNRHGYRK